jgi:uncharacterized protein YbaR (Trm112 family)
MKPWLLNILACPIDKHHPLEAHFFTWETPEEEIKLNAENAGKPSSEYEKNYKQLAKQLNDGTISPPAIMNITDSSESQSSKSLLTGAHDAITGIKRASEKSEKELLEEYPQGIDSLNRYMHLLEVDAGLLVCPECGRWYPIGSAVETIPEMLPDGLREEERDLEWMEKWSYLIPVKVLEDGKPYSTMKQ